MFKFIIIIFFLISKTLFAQDFKLVCLETNPSYDKNFSQSFAKIINFEEQTLLNFSGGFFDNVIMFGRSEIILTNRVFNTRSTFNISTNKWTTYKGEFIKLYDCTKEKRRF